VKPLETLARESALAITGRLRNGELGPLELFWGYTLDPEGFQERELVRVDGKDLKAMASLPVDQRRFSFQALIQNDGLEEIVDRALRRDEAGERLTQVESEALAMFRRLDLVAKLTRGSGLQLIPGAEPEARWSTPAELPPEAPMLADVRDAYAHLGEAYRAGDAAAFSREAARLIAGVRALAGPGYVDSAKIDRELLYNRLNAFGKAWGFYLGGLLMMALFGIARRRVGYWIGAALLVVGLAFHTVGIGLRWSIAGRAPVSDMYESLVFMGWGVVAIGLVLEGFYRKGYFATGAGLMGFVILAFSENLPIESSINPLVPVLANTSWLSIHVMTIMLSYSAFALAMALGHVTLFMQLFKPGKTEALRNVSGLLYKTLQVGVLFLAAGIAFGAIWANESWGRYWGWDPKETWSLITFFAYLALIHARYAAWIQNFGLSILTIACFLTVLMTYYGVNFILGAGLHSYGFASGGMLWVGLYVFLELAIIVAATVRYRGAVTRRVLAAEQF
jgi:cytochrome c-type biogenesis protein CcsB